MFDGNFNEPNIDSNYSQYDSYADSDSQKDIKKYLPFIIIGIVIIIIIVFVLMFFNSQRKIVFDITEFGGGSVGNATLTVRSSTNEIVYGPEQGSSHTITLMVGEYTYSVLSPDYKAKRDVFLTVDMEKTNEPVILEKDISANIEVLEEKEKIYFEQQLSGKILIEATQSDLKNQEILVNDSEKLLKITLNPNKVTVNQGGAITIDYELEVSNKTIKKSTETKITFTLKGTKINDDFTISVNPTVGPSEFVESNSTREKNKLIQDNKLVAGEEKIIQLTFENKSKNVDVDDILVEIVPDIEYENIKTEWNLSLTNSGIISKIEKDKKETLQLRMLVPITAKVGDDFKGKIIVSSNSLTEKKEYILILTVDKASIANLKLNKTSLKTDCEPECKTIKTAVEGLKIENTGNVDVTDVTIELDTTRSPLCEDWFDIKIGYFDSIPAKGSRTIDIDIIPLYISETDTTPCYLKFTYTDPTKTDRQVFITDPPLSIETKYDPPD